MFFVLTFVVAFPLSLCSKTSSSFIAHGTMLLILQYLYPWKKDDYNLGPTYLLSSWEKPVVIIIILLKHVILVLLTDCIPHPYIKLHTYVKFTNYKTEFNKYVQSTHKINVAHHRNSYFQCKQTVHRCSWKTDNNSWGKFTRHVGRQHWPPVLASFYQHWGWEQSLHFTLWRRGCVSRPPRQRKLRSRSMCSVIKLNYCELQCYW